MNDAMKVKMALEDRATALEAEADLMILQVPDARQQAGNASMLVFVKQQVAQEFRRLAEQIGTL